MMKKQKQKHGFIYYINNNAIRSLKLELNFVLSKNVCRSVGSGLSLPAYVM